MVKSELFYLVHLLKTDKRENAKFFVCSKRKGDEFLLPNIFHAIGYFGQQGEKSEDLFKADGKEEKEVWIPMERIDFIESLVYKPR